MTQSTVWIFAIAAFTTLLTLSSFAHDSSSDANTEATCTEVSKTWERAKAGLIDGTICFETLGRDKYSFELTLPADGVQKVYHVERAVCFGVPYAGGCNYAPTRPSQVDIANATTRRCVDGTKYEVMSTTRFAMTSYYSIVIQPGACQMPNGDPLVKDPNVGKIPW